jgi:hypothetical protein
MDNGKMKDGGKLIRLITSHFSTFSILRFSTFIILVSSFFLISASPKHDYHVSVTQMQYNPGTKLFEVSIRIFTDDLEKALGQTNGNRRFSIRNNDQNDVFVSGYIQKHFVLADDQKKVLPIRYVGKEQEEDATWVYAEIPFKMPLTGCKLQNSILAETFEDQVNMTNITVSSGKKTYLFKKGQLVHSL